MDEDFVRGEVVPNGEAMVEDLPVAEAALPPFAPASEEVAMSKMPLPPGAFAEDDLPEADEVIRPPLPFELEPCPPRFWATRAQHANRQKNAVRAMRILMCPFLSG